MAGNNRATRPVRRARSSAVHPGRGSCSRSSRRWHPRSLLGADKHWKRVFRRVWALPWRPRSPLWGGIKKTGRKTGGGFLLVPLLLGGGEPEDWKRGG